MTSSIQTYSGKEFWPLEPRVEDVCIEDIAHALANQCRFGGHTERFYSVADHSVRVSEIVPATDALWGLLHDAAEAYLVDLPRPLKQDPTLGPTYKRCERRLMAVICERFGLAQDEPTSIKIADNRLLMTERRDLLKQVDWAWENCGEPLSDRIMPRSPEAAKAAFLARFRKILCDQRSKEAQ